MTPRPSNHRRASRSSRMRGFSFTEIMFAVIILGIGFIMIASIFPVAIQQGKLTGEETSAAAVAREALSYLTEAGKNSDSLPTVLFPPSSVAPVTAADGTKVYFPGAVKTIDGVSNPGLWKAIKANLILPSDPRFAFVCVYRRDGYKPDPTTWSPFAQVWFIPATTRTRTNYDPGTDASGTTAGMNLQARGVNVSIYYPPGTPSLAGNGGYVLLDWVASGANSYLTEGCYVMIADDHITGPFDLPANPTLNRNLGRMNGRVYHVGGRRPDLDCVNGATNGVAYDLAPDGDFVPDFGANGRFDPLTTATQPNTPDPASDDIVTIGMKASGSGPNTPVGSDLYGNASGPATAFVLGTDRSGAEPGKAQDISAFTTFIKVN